MNTPYDFPNLRGRQIIKILKLQDNNIICVNLRKSACPAVPSEIRGSEGQCPFHLGRAGRSYWGVLFNL